MSWLRMWSCQCPAVFTVSSRVPLMQLWKLASASAISGERSKKIKFLSPSPWILNGPRGRPEFKNNPLRVTNLPEGHTQDSPGSDFLDVFVGFQSRRPSSSCPRRLIYCFNCMGLLLLFWGADLRTADLVSTGILWSADSIPTGFRNNYFPFQRCAISLVARGCRGSEEEGW